MRLREKVGKEIEGSRKRQLRSVYYTISHLIILTFVLPFHRLFFSFEILFIFYSINHTSERHVYGPWKGAL